MPKMKMKPVPRWHAVVSYRHRGGRVEVDDFYLDELHELHDAVETGPHWDTVLSIVVHRINHNESATLTVERAEEL